MNQLPTPLPTPDTVHPQTSLAIQGGAAGHPKRTLSAPCRPQHRLTRNEGCACTAESATASSQAALSPPLTRLATRLPCNTAHSTCVGQTSAEPWHCRRCDDQRPKLRPTPVRWLATPSTSQPRCVSRYTNKLESLALFQAGLGSPNPKPRGQGHPLQLSTCSVRERRAPRCHVIIAAGSTIQQF